MWDIWKKLYPLHRRRAVVFWASCGAQTVPTLGRPFVPALRICGGQILGSSGTARTERDFPIALTIIGALALVQIAAPTLPTAWAHRAHFCASIVFGFLFVTVSSRIVDSSVPPPSCLRLTITTLMITSLVFLMMGWTESHICASQVWGCGLHRAANAGNTLQVKDRILVGATPWKQQTALLIGISARPSQPIVSDHAAQGRMAQCGIVPQRYRQANSWRLLFRVYWNKACRGH